MDHEDTDMDKPMPLHLICAGLSRHGFEDDAIDLLGAKTPAEERAAINRASCAVAGYQLALWRHWRALGHTSARAERDDLQAIADSLVDRLVRLSSTFHKEIDFAENDARMAAAMRKAQEVGG